MALLAGWRASVKGTTNTSMNPTWLPQPFSRSCKLHPDAPVKTCRVTEWRHQGHVRRDIPVSRSMHSIRGGFVADSAPYGQPLRLSKHRPHTKKYSITLTGSQLKLMNFGGVGWHMLNVLSCGNSKTRKTVCSRNVLLRSRHRALLQS